MQKGECILSLFHLFQAVAFHSTSQKMSLFHNSPLIWFWEHAGVCLWRCMMSCQLKMCTAQSSEAFLTCMCVCRASLCTRKHLKTFQEQQKSSTQCYQTEKGSWILDVCVSVWTETYLWEEEGPLLPHFLPFSFLLLSLLLTVFDCIRQVNEKRHRSAACTCHCVCLYVCIPATVYV